MGFAKAATIVLFFIENTDQVDDSVDAFELGLELLLVEYVRFNQGNARYHQQVLVTFAISGEYAYRATACSQIIGNL